MTAPAVRGGAPAGGDEVKRRQVTIVVATLFALAVAVVLLAQLNRSDVAVAGGSVAVTRDGASLRSFTMAEVRALRSASAEKAIVSSSHDDEKGTFTGVPLRDLLAEVDPDLLDEAKQIVVRATDGYVSAFGVDEVRGSDDVLLVYAKDDASLGTDEDGGTGPFRIVVLSDPYGNRCTKWVNEIEIR